MSKKRQFEENPECPDALLALFVEIATGGQRTATEWSAVWERVLADRWLHFEVRRRAELLVASHHLHEDTADDIAQQVFLYLARKGKSDPTLHFKPELLKGGFTAWIGTILNRASSEAARLIGEYRPQHAVLREDDDLARVPPDWTRRADVVLAVEQLQGRQHDVMTLFLIGLGRREIGEQLGLSYKQVRYAIEQAVLELELRLEAYRP